MTTLVDRYVWAVLRSIPESERAALEPEVRALVADAIEARAGDGPRGADAERAALLELGDPEVLAARYTGRQRSLIGPRFYADWRRVLSIVLPIAVPIASLAVAGASLAGGGAVIDALGAGVSTAIAVAVQATFWVTVVFALLERGTHSSEPVRRWSPDDLPAVPGPARSGWGELAGSVAASVLLIVAIVWQQLAAPIVVNGTGYPLLDPALWSSWLPWFIAVAVAQIALAVALARRGRWTLGLAGVNAGLGLAFAGPGVWLLQTGRLLNPALVDALEPVTGTAWLTPTLGIVAVVVIGLTAWDAIDGFRKARTASPFGTEPTGANGAASAHP